MTPEQKVSGKPMSTQARYYIVYLSLILLGTIAVWPIFWIVDCVVGSWMFMPAILTAAVFYWFLCAGISAAKELGDKACKQES